jgi:hypothetical protein
MANFQINNAKIEARDPNPGPAVRSLQALASQLFY